MILFGFNHHYRVLHFTEEIGEFEKGSIAYFINEWYRHHSNDVGFVHLYDDQALPDLSSRLYPGTENIIAIPLSEFHRIGTLSFDVAVVHDCRLSIFADDQFLQGRPLVFVVHSLIASESMDLQNQFEMMCNQAQIIVCVSYVEHRKLCKKYPHLVSKTKVIHYGTRFEHHEWPDRSRRSSRLRFGFIGRMEDGQGVLECMKALKHLNAEFHMACGNEDPYYLSDILGFIEAADLQNKVHFYGWCKGERRRQFLQSLDALIVPSHEEPTGYVALEALQYQIPLLCSNGGGLVETIGTYRYQFDPYDPMSLKEKIVQFQNDSDDRIQEEMNTLTERTRTLFASENMVVQYMSLLESIMNRRTS